MRSAAVLQLESQASRDWRLCEPARFLPVHAIYQLTIRDVENKGEALRERLAAIPTHLRGARSWLDMEPAKIPLIWLESATAEAEGGAEFFRELKQHPEINNYRVSEELEQAAHALEDFSSYLKIIWPKTLKVILPVADIILILFYRKDIFLISMPMSYINLVKNCLLKQSRS